MSSLWPGYQNRNLNAVFFYSAFELCRWILGKICPFLLHTFDGDEILARELLQTIEIALKILNFFFSSLSFRSFIGTEKKHSSFFLVPFHTRDIFTN